LGLMAKVWVYDLYTRALVRFVEPSYIDYRL